MVRAPVDTLHCPKICNHLIVIAILLYCHYGTSGVKSPEHVVSWEMVLNFFRFPEMNQNCLMGHACLFISSSNDNRKAAERPPN